MGSVERARHAIEDRERARWRHGLLALQQPAEVGSLDVAHRDEQHAVGLVGIVDRDHVRMIQRRRQARLAQEPLPELLVLSELGRQQLQRDMPVEPLVVGEVDDRHPTPTEHPLDPVAGDLGSDARVNINGASHEMSLGGCGSGRNQTGRGRGLRPSWQVERPRTGGASLRESVYGLRLTRA